MKSILVTGAAGFIGSAIARELLELGNKIVTVDNLSTGNKECIPTDCEFYEGDISDIEVINKLEKHSFDTIIHMAGQSSGEVSFEDPVYDLQTNTQSSIMLSCIWILIIVLEFSDLANLSAWLSDRELKRIYSIPLKDLLANFFITNSYLSIHFYGCW